MFIIGKTIFLLNVEADGALLCLFLIEVLELVGIDYSSQIRVDNLVVRKEIIEMFLMYGEIGSENCVQFIESYFFPNDKSSDVSFVAGVSYFSILDISLSLEDWNILFTVEDERSSFGSISSVF